MVCEGCAKSWWRVVAKVLVIVGGINWGLVGLGMLLDGANNWNVVNMVLGGTPTWEAVVYLLVGISAIVKIFSCGCYHKMEGGSSAGESQGM